MRRIALILALLTIGAAQPLFATPLGFVYKGGVFTVEVVSGTSPDTSFDIRYAADLTNFTGDEGQEDYLYGVGFKNPEKILSGSVTSGGGQPAWTFSNDQLSANGCRNGDDSFACYSTWTGSSFANTALPTVAPIGSPLIYQWVFHLTYTKTVSLDLTGQTIKAAFSSDSTGDDQESMMLGDAQTVVPEPASLLLLGTGLLGVTGAARRFRRR